MRVSAIVVCLVLVSSFVFAGDAPPKMEPTEGHKVLGMWVGKWSGSGELKASPMGPGGKMTWTEECSWFEGAGFHVVCKSKGEGPMGKPKGMGVMGYNPMADEYSHFGVDSSGWAGYATGKKTGNKYVFTSTENMGDKKMYSRFHMTVESPTKLTFSWEMSEDGSNWAVLMTGTSEKQ